MWRSLHNLAEFYYRQWYIVTAREIAGLDWGPSSWRCRRVRPGWGGAVGRVGVRTPARAGAGGGRIAGGESVERARCVDAGVDAGVSSGRRARRLSGSPSRRRCRALRELGLQEAAAGLCGLLGPVIGEGACVPRNEVVGCYAPEATGGGRGRPCRSGDRSCDVRRSCGVLRQQGGEHCHTHIDGPRSLASSR